MGVSSDAILAFGFQVGGDDQEPPEWLLDEDGNTMDFDELVCGPYEVGCDYAARKAKIEACPADLVTFCSYNYPMYLLCVRGTEIRCHRGAIKDITSFDVDAEKMAEFKAWCEEHNIGWKEPRWRLVSMYG